MHKLLSSHQSGNRKYYSTETINIAVTDALLEAMDAEDIFYPYPTWSFKSSFGSMDHYILLRKISHLGASPLVHIVYSWFVKVHVPSINRIWNTPSLHFVTSFVYNLHQIHTYILLHNTYFFTVFLTTKSLSQNISITLLQISLKLHEHRGCYWRKKLP